MPETICIITLALSAFLAYILLIRRIKCTKERLPTKAKVKLTGKVYPILFLDFIDQSVALQSAHNVIFWIDFKDAEFEEDK